MVKRFKIFLKSELQTNDIVKTRRSITFKIALLAWGLIISSIVITGIFNFINQQKIILERMKIEASNVAESIIHVHANSMFTDKYESVIDYCSNLISSSNSIEYVILTKHDGNSLIFKRGSWRYQTLHGTWTFPDEFYAGKITYSEILNIDSYRYSKPFIYTGISWGFVHVGISLASFHEVMKDLIWRTGIFSLSFIFIGLFVAIVFSKKLTRPIKELVKTTREIEAGNLNVKAEIFSNDELGFLAHSFNSMTLAVRKSNDLLETTVEERTIELGTANKKLIEEVDERARAQVKLHRYAVKLETLEEVYKGIIKAETSDDLFSNTISNINKYLIKLEMAGLCLYDKDNLLEKINTYILQDGKIIRRENDYPPGYYSEFNMYDDAEYYIKNNSGDENDNTPMGNLIFREGLESYYSFPMRYQNELIGEMDIAIKDNLLIENDGISILTEISHHVSVAVMQLYLEEKLRIHSKEMKRSLEEKETLLKEIHHRVKNNLQVISSLLYLQSKNIKDEETLAIFRESQMRVQSLALVHEKLYQSSNLSRIDFAEYIKNLALSIKGSYKISMNKISIKFELEKIYLNIDKSVPLGLILNELLSNSFKYAFPDSLADDRENYILIKFTSVPDRRLILMVSDNGVGIPEDFILETSNSLGLKIVKNLLSQINGTLKIKNKDNTEFVVEFDS